MKAKFLWLLVLAGLLALPAQATERLALVIGIDGYAELPHLKKARNDATAVANSMQHLGMDVILLLDADRRNISRAISDMAAKSGPGDEVLFYFAGHGIQIDGRNFLIPADAPAATPGDEAFLMAESIPVDQVMETLKSRGASTAVLILDACRDNPFPRSGTRTVGNGRGLAPETAVEGSFILYSAGAGQTALDRLSDDDADPNSVFTRNLLPFLNDPDRPLQEIVRSLRTEVEAQAATIGHSQRPAYYDELTGDYLLAALKAPPPAVVPVAEGPCVSAARDWDGVVAMNDPALLRAFAVAHFSCEALRTAALERVKELERGVVQTEPEVKAEAPVAEAPVAEAPVAEAKAEAPVAEAEAPEVAAAAEASEGKAALPAAEAGLPASIDRAPALAAPTDSAAPDLPAIVDLPPQPDLSLPAATLFAEAAQTELKRLGCYRGQVDGDWGRGSRAALARFYKAAKQKDIGADPTEAVLALLKQPANAACPPPARVAAKPASVDRSAKAAAAEAPAEAPAKSGTKQVTTTKATAKQTTEQPPVVKKKCRKVIILPIPFPIEVC